MSPPRWPRDDLPRRPAHGGARESQGFDHREVQWANRPRIREEPEADPRRRFEAADLPTLLRASDVSLASGAQAHQAVSDLLKVDTVIAQLFIAQVLRIEPHRIRPFDHAVRFKRMPQWARHALIDFHVDVEYHMARMDEAQIASMRKFTREVVCLCPSSSFSRAAVDGLQHALEGSGVNLQGMRLTPAPAALGLPDQFCITWMAKNGRNLKAAWSYPVLMALARYRACRRHDALLRELQASMNRTGQEGP